jgi:hypothetical protein
MKIYERSRGIATLVLNLGSRWRQMVKITARPGRFTPAWWPLNAGLRGRSERTEMFLDPAAIRIPDLQTYSIVSTPITLSWFLNKAWGCNCFFIFVLRLILYLVLFLIISSVQKLRISLGSLCFNFGKHQFAHIVWKCINGLLLCLILHFYLQWDSDPSGRAV